MEEQLIPIQYSESVHQLMNYFHSFSSDLQMEEQITAEEFFVALESMEKNEKFDMLINYFAATIVQNIFRDIKLKNKHQYYLSYEYDYQILKQMRTCFRKIDESLKTFMKMWREFLVFFFQIKTFCKQYLIENHNASKSRRRQRADEDEESEEEQEQNSRNSEMPSKGSKDQSENSDIEDQDSSNDKQNEEKSESKKKFKDIPYEDYLYEHYKCRSIIDTDVQFGEFSTSEKLQAFAALVKIGYKLPFCSQFFSNRFKNIIKADELKLIQEQSEKITEMDAVKQQFDENDLIVQKYCESVQNNIRLLSQEDLKEYNKKKQKHYVLKSKMYSLESIIKKYNEELKLNKKKQFFQYSNWILLGKDKDKNLFYICAYETSLVFKKVFKVNDNDLTSSNIECLLYYYDNLTTLKSELDLSNISDDSLWQKINALKSDETLTIPEEKASSIIESNSQQRKSMSNYQNIKFKQIKENLLQRSYCFIEKPRTNPFSSVSTNKKKSTVSKQALDELESYSYDRRVTRGSVTDNKKKTLIIGDSDDEEDQLF